MKKLKLSFLDNSLNVDRPDLIRILEDYGDEITEYGKDYFSYIVTTGSSEGVLTDLSLYIVVPEIGYDYKAINVGITDAGTLLIRFSTLVTKQIETCKVDVSKGTTEFEAKLADIFSSDLFNASLRFLVGQVHIKREYSEEVRGKIKIGEARVAILKSGERINVGFMRIEGDQVIYYTGKGLREIFRPNMSEEEEVNARRLKELTEEELLQQGYIAKKNISDFDDIE